MTDKHTTLEVPEMNVAAFSDTLELRTEGLFKKYGKRTVVNDVSFNVRQGEIVGLLGPNGAGKTTLINKTINLLKEKYNEEDILSLKQPTDLSRKTKLFQKMMYSENHEDIDYRAVQLLTMSDRVQHGFETIEPALKMGKIVVCDRYVYTSYVNMVARGYTKEKWFKNVSKHILKPDIKFLAYVKPSEAIKRIKARPEEKDKYLLIYAHFFRSKTLTLP